MFCEGLSGVTSQDSHFECHGIWDKLTSFIFWNFKVSLASLERFQKFQKRNMVNLAHIYLNTNWYYVTKLICTTSFVNVQFIVNLRS